MILTPWEAIKYGPFRHDFPTSAICNHINRVEKSLFEACYLGYDLYVKLLNDLMILDAQEYTLGSYNLNEIILYNGAYLMSTEDNNTTHPDDDTENKWICARKFKSDCYENLFNEHLKYWLALEICLTSIRYSTYQAGSKGLIKVNTGEIQTVNEKEFSAFKKELRVDADTELSNMYNYMVRHSECFNMQSESCGKSVCKPKKRRRFYFKIDKV